jgi:hypothetical protein
MKLDIRSEQQLRQWLVDPQSAVFRKIDLRPHSVAVEAAPLQGCAFIGCTCWKNGGRSRETRLFDHWRLQPPALVRKVARPHEQFAGTPITLGGNTLFKAGALPFQAPASNHYPQDIELRPH